MKISKFYKLKSNDYSISFRTNFMISCDQFWLPDVLFNSGGIF